MFIATCNQLEQIPGPLRDRMEVINLSGYTQEEKFFISRKYLIPKQTSENGLKPEQIEFTDAGIQAIVENYTREAGLRNLERLMGTVCRKTARLVAEGKTDVTKIDPAMVAKYLGPAIYTREDEQDKDEVGITTGLAWTSVGGEILYVETTATRGKGGMLLTGQLGDVMKESAQAALGLIRWRAADFGINPDTLSETDLHVHFPQGGIPKDGPSAGITMATAIISRLTGIAVRKDVAMTGEITLTGRVLPIGGLKEKALAAMRHGIKTVIIPEKNRKDLEEIPDEYRKHLTFVPVKSIDEVLEVALTHKVTPIETTHTVHGGEIQEARPSTGKNKKQKPVAAAEPAVAKAHKRSA
jgi:ATP-dependent Lon protease